MNAAISYQSIHSWFEKHSQNIKNLFIFHSGGTAATVNGKNSIKATATPHQGSGILKTSKTHS